MGCKGTLNSKDVPISNVIQRTEELLFGKGKIERMGFSGPNPSQLRSKGLDDETGRDTTEPNRETNTLSQGK